MRVHRILAWVAAPVLLAAAIGFSEDYGLLLVGRHDDFRQLKAQSPQGHEFTFVRLIYNGRTPGYLKNWYTDYPKGDRQLIQMLQRLVGIDAAPEERAIPINHPDLFRYPMVYSCEAGQMLLDERDAATMREYLSRGGFWMIDDFWGSFEWKNFEATMQQILPEHEIVDVPPDHPIFHTFFDIETVLQVPNVGYAYCAGECPTWELDGYRAHVRGISDRNGRLLVLINFNTDLMDASEWADDPRYPHEFSTYSYKIFANAVVYAMTH